MPLRQWAVVPAAGSGQRMGRHIPKQYLPLAGRTVIEWALAPLLAIPAIGRIVVPLASDDRHWSTLPVARDMRVTTTSGGATRADSVLAGLEALGNAAAPDDWVLVHDAARPCLALSDAEKLLAELADDSVGGLLATPLPDTLKRTGDDQRVAATVPREGLWRALTPQMFRLGTLRNALEHCRRQGIVPTDEAAAIEALGFKPKLVAGRADNLKVTLAEDLVLAETILAGRDRK